MSRSGFYSMQRERLARGGGFAPVRFRDILLLFLVCQVVCAFLWILAHEVENPEDSPYDQREQPEVAPDTPGEEVIIQVGARENQRIAQNADHRQPAQVAIKHIFDERLVLDKAFAPLNAIIERDQDADAAKDEPGDIKMKRFRPAQPAIYPGCPRIGKQPLNQVEVHSIQLPSVASFAISINSMTSLLIIAWIATGVYRGGRIEYSFHVST